MTPPSPDGSTERTLSEALKTAAKPTTFHEVIGFYYDVVKPLYATASTINALPQETLFELNAAFDHLTRHWYYGEPPEEVIPKVYSHLKRSCLDVFKLHVKRATDQMAELRRFETGVIDNGDFDRGLIELYSRIHDRAQEARVAEGRPVRPGTGHDHVFSLWAPVYDDCITLDKKFYRREAVTWAKKRHGRGAWRERIITGVLIGFVVGVLSGIASTAAWEWMKTEPRPATPPTAGLAPASAPSPGVATPLAAPRPDRPIPPIRP